MAQTVNNPTNAREMDDPFKYSSTNISLLTKELRRKGIPTQTDRNNNLVIHTGSINNTNNDNNRKHRLTTQQKVSNLKIQITKASSSRKIPKSSKKVKLFPLRLFFVCVFISKLVFMIFVCVLVYFLCVWCL